MKACRTVSEIVEQIARTIDDEKCRYPADTGAEFFFRGERKNYDAPRPFGTHFDSLLDRYEGYVRHERDIYEDALRLNVVTFRDDRTMCDRLARMQHYGFPTRFADISTNALLSAFFASGGERADAPARDDEDGYIRILKVARPKMKSSRPSPISRLWMPTALSFPTGAGWAWRRLRTRSKTSGRDFAIRLRAVCGMWP